MVNENKIVLSNLKIWEWFFHFLLQPELALDSVLHHTISPPETKAVLYLLSGFTHPFPRRGKMLVVTHIFK